MKTILAFVFSVLFSASLYAQNGISVNTTGSVSHPSAMLDVSATDAGLLIPRMTELQKSSINSPATGLMIYQTDGLTGFWYFNGSSWVQSLGAAGVTGATGVTGPTGAAGASGLLPSGSATGNTPYWDGSQWVVSSSNIFNNGGAVGIGTITPHSSASLELNGVTTGFLINRMTTVERNAISNPADGLQIFNTTTNCINVYIGTAWKQLCPECDFAKPIITSNSPLCEGNTLSLSATEISGATYSWTGPNGFTSTDRTPEILNATTSATGIYSLTATLNGCTSDVVQYNVSVNFIPISPIAGGNSPVCEGGVLNLTASSVQGATYLWSGPAGFSSTLQNPVVANVSNSGDYSVVAIVNACYSPPDAVNINVLNSRDALGGTISYVNKNGIDYKVHTFISSGSFEPNICITEVEVLVVGGGGGGGSSCGGGGGAGGLIYNQNYSVTPGNAVQIVVGGGGNSFSKGDNSSFGALVATGGGAGSNGANLAFIAGGSGGGQNAFTSPNIGGVGTPGMGNNGGVGHPNCGGGGGGGAGNVGYNAASFQGGNGGAGLSYDISGVSKYYAGGGAGYGGQTWASGGAGGGGNTGMDALDNTGGGGGADNGSTVGKGGSGIVIIRYPIP